MLSDLQTRKITRMFEVLDSDRNGYIEPSDMERLAADVASAIGVDRGSPLYEALQDRYLTSWDEARPFMDREGRVSLPDYLRYHDQLVSMPVAFEGHLRSLARFVFAVLDTDADGKITREELRRFQSAHGVSAELSETIFPMLDLDGDGFISATELIQMLREYYLSADPSEPGNWLFGPIEAPLDAH